jgi:hypothetical protein
MPYAPKWGPTEKKREIASAYDYISLKTDVCKLIKTAIPQSNSIKSPLKYNGKIECSFLKAS